MFETIFYCLISFGIGICFAAYFYEKTIQFLERELTSKNLLNRIQ